MHATGKLSQDIKRVLQYHELKVERGVATLIHAENFIKDTHELSYQDKLYPFERLMAKNELATHKVMHVFLGYAAGEKPTNETMVNIAKDYMPEMKYRDQPWLAYRHCDTLHPHVHIVSTTIQANGKRIPLTLNDLKHSREVTHRLEKKYSLDINSGGSFLTAVGRDYVQSVQYGKTSLYPTMQKVLDSVVTQYKYTNLDELNAVLRLYNMEASRGKENSFTYQNGGLIYYPLSDDGRRQGAYIKASAFEGKPTLANLEKRFASNEGLREPDRRRVTTSVDWILAGDPPSMTDFKENMDAQRISMVQRADKNGETQIWYVDHQAKTVFGGKVLGERYTVKSIGERCGPESESLVLKEKQEQKMQIKLSL